MEGVWPIIKEGKIVGLGFSIRNGIAGVGVADVRAVAVGAVLPITVVTVETIWCG